MILFYVILALCVVVLLMHLYTLEDWDGTTAIFGGILLGVLLSLIVIAIADRQEPCTRVVRGEQVLAEIGDC